MPDQGAGGMMGGGMMGGMGGGMGGAMMGGGFGMMGMGMAMDPNTKPARELYIGNLPTGVNSQQVQDFLNAAMSHAKLTIVSGIHVWVNNVSKLSA